MNYPFNPKITIATVCFNSVETIGMTIESVLNQSYENIEFVIIDGGSKDGTIDVIKKFDNEIIKWVSEPDKGIYDAMNKAIQKATGDYICFLGADDFLFNQEVIAKVANLIKQNPLTDILCGRVVALETDTDYQKIYWENMVETSDYWSFFSMPHQGMFARLELMKKEQFNLDYEICADKEFLLKCYFNKKAILYTEEVISYFCLSGVSSKKFFHRKLIEKQSILQIYTGKRFILKYYMSFLLFFLKTLLWKMGLLSIIRQYQKWDRHYCVWGFCKWCK